MIGLFRRSTRISGNLRVASSSRCGNALISPPPSLLRSRCASSVTGMWGHSSNDSRPCHDFSTAAANADSFAQTRHHKESLQNPEQFWSEQAKHIHWMKPFDQVLQKRHVTHPETGTLQSSSHSPSLLIPHHLSSSQSPFITIAITIAIAITITMDTMHRLRFLLNVPPDSRCRRCV